MPRIKKNVETNQKLEEQDNHENLCIDEVIEGHEPTVSTSVVKMKLTQFCPNKQLRCKINSIVQDMNNLIGQGYAFANLHILKILNSCNEVLPKIDRSFYYRCLIAVSENKCRTSTLNTSFLETKNIFDSLREPNTKISIIGHNQVVADLSISMATMATNHLWTNIVKRLTRFIRWSQPSIKPILRKKIISSVIFEPTKDIKSIFEFKSRTKSKKKSLKDQEKDAKEILNNEKAKQVAIELRSYALLPSSLQCASRAHLLLPLYFHMLKQTEASKKLHEDKKKKFGGRMFTLLPLKNGHTTNYIQFSSMSLLTYLKSMNLEKFKGDGRNVDAYSILKKYFNVNLVETRHKKFANRIVTDGLVVSVVMNKKSNLECHVDCPCASTLKLLYQHTSLEKSNIEHVNVVSVDPGITDVVSTLDNFGTKKSFSSAKYYEDAYFNKSRRLINKWNAETVEMSSNILESKTSNLQTFCNFILSYMSNASKLIEHRMNKGYRNMRFMRYIHRNKTINNIVELIAPSNEFTVVGFGDWKGPNGTPIKRRCAGPLQEIKERLSKKENVVLLSIPEFNTSKTCSNCLNTLVNMKASSTKYRRNENGERISYEDGIHKVHKVLHCRSSQASIPCCGKTWNRDVNASINILNLTLRYMQGLERPEAFVRKNKKK